MPSPLYSPTDYYSPGTFHPVSSTNPELITYEHPVLHWYKPQLRLVEDAWIGQDAWFTQDFVLSGGKYQVRLGDAARAQLYLPPETQEPPDAYLNRLRRSVWRNRFRRAIEADFSSLLSVFDLIDAPESLKRHSSNIDGRGTNLELFVKHWVSLALRDGAAFVFTHYPPGGDQIRSRAEFLQSDRRPWLCLHKRSDVLNWDFDYAANGVMQLNEVVVRDRIWGKVGTYGHRQEFRYLHYIREDNGTVTRLVYSVEQGSNGYTQKEEPDQRGSITLPFIPLSCLSFDANGFEAELPLIHLARLNVLLYQKESDKNQQIHQCASPTLVVNDLPSQIGDTLPRNITLGSHAVLRNVDATFLELQGQSLPIAQADIRDLLNDMDAETLAFLSGQATPPTATQVRYDAAQTVANIKGMAIALKSAAEEVMRAWASYESPRPVDQAGTLDVNNQILRMPTEGTAKDIFDGMAQGLISRELGFLLLRTRGFFPPEVTDEVIARELAMGQGQTQAAAAEATAADTVPLGL